MYYHPLCRYLELISCESIVALCYPNSNSDPPVLLSKACPSNRRGGYESSLRDTPMLLHQLHSPRTAHMLHQDLMIEQFDYGTQSVVSISVRLRDIAVVLPRLHSPPTAHVSYQDLRIARS